MGTLGQVGLVAGGPGWFPTAVRIGAGSQFSHVIIDVGSGYVASAQLGGTVLTLAEYYGDIVWSRYRFRGDQAQTVADFARAHIGAPYNVAAAAAVVLSRLLTLHLPPTRSLRFYQCAQLAEDALIEAGVVPYTSHREPGPASPRTFQAEYITRGWYTPALRPQRTLT